MNSFKYATIIQMFWNLWCEKVKFLCPGNSGSSRSETSVATSTTGSSLYLIDRRVVTTNGIRQLWAKFGPNLEVNTNFINSQSLVRKWKDRYLYLGNEFHEAPWDYKPIMKEPSIDEFVRPKRSKQKCKAEYPTYAGQKCLAFGDSVQVNRFGSGILEGCRTGLYLTCDDYVVPNRFNSTIIRSSVSNTRIDWGGVDYEEMAEAAVLLWEYSGNSKLQNNHRVRHRRRYGFASKPLYLYGLGPWHVSKGDRFSLLFKTAVSEVNLRSVTNESPSKLPISKRQLFATISCPFLSGRNQYKANTLINAPKRPLIFFWTPGYWYRPISAKDAYNELQKHLKKIKNYHETKSKGKRRKCSGRKFLRRFSLSREKETDEDEDEEMGDKKKRNHSFLAHMLSTKIEGICEWDHTKHTHETPFQHLRRILKTDISTTAWDFDSTVLAQQLTMIDRDLFLKIPSTEFGALLWQQHSKNAPNIAALIAFSCRISSLIASEILRDDSEKIRARLMARFINVANKCHQISNFHSCRSVLYGLQNPAIFRLKKTWAYVRKKHASKYQAFEFLCRLYRDPRMPSFQKTFFLFSQHPPYMPFIGHLIAKLLDKVPEYKIQTFRRPVSRQLSICTTKSSQYNTSKKSEIQSKHEDAQNLFSKLLSVFSNPSTSPAAGDSEKMKIVVKRRTRQPTTSIRFKGLYEYFKPMDQYEDNREEKLLEVIDLLEKGQLGAIHYNFSCNELARDFLLKARHYDDQENFFNSINMESSRLNSIRTKN